MNLITAGNTHRPPTLRNMPLEATLLATPSPFQYKPSPNIFSRFFSLSVSAVVDTVAKEGEVGTKRVGGEYLGEGSGQATGSGHAGCAAGE